jgi:hypothetical protein
MSGNFTASQQQVKDKDTKPPYLDISKLGIVSRNYRDKYENGRRDFSQKLSEVLNFLDKKGCDAVLFSLYSIVPRREFDVLSFLERLKNIKAVFLEEFKDHPRVPGTFKVFHISNQGWHAYEFFQKFKNARHPQEIANFVSTFNQRRVLGGCCVLLCGESNGVKYSKIDKMIYDEFGLRETIPGNVNLVLNPIHDRMIRFEMKLKRQFLSENNRWVVSVWNKGKEYKNGRTMDGGSPAWTVFHNGSEKEVKPEPNQLGLEIGIVDVKR